MRFLKSASLTVAALGLLALPAMADWHGGYCRGGGVRWSVGIGVPLVAPAPYYGAYYGPYYRPAYYDPYYYDAPVAVGRPVAGNSVAVDAQRVLAVKGYYRGACDGVLGPQSRAAIRAWQADCRLPMTGDLDARTLRSLALL